MTTGTLAGFVFFLDPSASANAKSDFSGSSQLYFEGVVYLPTQQINLSGSAVNFTPAPFTSYIGNTIVLSGSSALKINSDPSQTSDPIPAALIPPKPLRLTQ